MQTQATPSAVPVDIISCILLLHKQFHIALPLPMDR